MRTGILLEDHFGDIIQKARMGKGLSLAELASATGITQSQLQQIEDYAFTPPEDQMHHLAACLGLDAQKLIAIANGKWTPEPPPHSIEEKVIIIRGMIGVYPVNGYILFDGQTQEAACIDTAFDPEKMLKAIAAHHLNLRSILLTHCHQDHMGGVEALKEKTGATLYLHREEMPLFSRQSRLTPDGFIEEGIEISVGRLRLRPLSTPGHTLGGATYTSEGVCFVGDALFAGSTGRSMSPQGYQSLLISLRQKVLSLPEKTVIFPGHGPPTTVGEEKRHNPFF